MEADPWSKPSSRAGRRRLLRFAAWGVAIALLVGLLLRLVSAHYGVGVFARPFDRERWLEAESDRSNQKRTRAVMAANLVQCHLEVGMARAEVLELLGPPDADPPIAPREPGDEIYMLGPTPMQKARFLWWGLTSSSDPDSPDDFSEAAELVPFRALVIAFDDAGLLRRFEIEER